MFQRIHLDDVVAQVAARKASPAQLASLPCATSTNTKKRLFKTSRSSPKHCASAPALGTSNFDDHSFRLNDEANLTIYVAHFAARLVEVFDSDKSTSRLDDARGNRQ